MADLQKQVEIEKSLDQLAFYLDDLFRVPGTGWRFGLDAVIGLIPNIGDTITVLPSFYILLAGVRHGVPKITLLRMAANIGVDYVVGSIPFIGDAFDFVWKANDMNIRLIRERATGRNAGTAGDYLFLLVLLLLLVGLLVGSIIASGLILWWVFTSRPLV
ncbi:MAG: DUF4112 domain-containing protein [Acidobacteria bacterium]|nr:DUF4112 domain-containing protein [Acidobacteriota bacterium]